MKFNRTTTDSITLPSGSVYVQSTVSVALSGYTPLAVICAHPTSASISTIAQGTLSGTNVVLTILTYNRASASADITARYNIDVLYVKN